ncbi:hypothetical protein ACR6C2_14620 [Streptomyces sp. INA 01156]
MLWRSRPGPGGGRERWLWQGADHGWSFKVHGGVAAGLGAVLLVLAGLTLLPASCRWPRWGGCRR